MENETTKDEIKKEHNLPPVIHIGIVLVVVIIGVSLYVTQLSKNKTGETLVYSARHNVQNEISLPNSVEIPVKWGDIGVKMVEAGVIDKAKFESIYTQRGGLSETEKKLLTDKNNGNIVITSQNSGVMLNMLWALGLGNKNPILLNGPMMDVQYGGAGKFASTGGWTLASGNAMDHYSKHSLIPLTSEQQAVVERVAKNIYRPCCNNSTYFPDCNHGMAMLGLLELMASQGVSETDMYRVALRVNTLWFPDTYETIRIYMKNKGVEWKDVNPQEILGINYSSASGYTNIASQVTKPTQRGGGCSI